MNPIPEVSSRTHILALLGVSDPDPAEGDGWFIADFCLLNRLLEGLGNTQVWLTSVDLDSTVDNYGPILHGNPFRPRRVVYDSTQPLSNLMVLPENDLREVFLDYLRSICAIAAANKEPILLIFIGHGEEGTFGLCIGDQMDDGSSVTILPDDVRKVLRNGLSDNSPVATVLSSCFSGGWLSTDESVLAAVRPHAESDSYQRSASGSARGGLFIHAIANTMQKEEACKATYKIFTENITVELARLFSFLVEVNPPVYSAKGDTWDEPQERLTGLDPSAYQKRYEELPVVPANPHEGGSDRQRGSRRGKLPSLGTLGSARSLLAKLVSTYRILNPRHQTSAGNVAVEGKIALFRGEIPGRAFTAHDTAWLAVALRTRNTMAAAVCEYVSALRLRPFRGFSDFDLGDFAHDKELADMVCLLQRFPALFPAFPFGQPPGLRAFTKPKFYVAVAFLLKGIDCAEAYDRLCLLQTTLYPDQNLPEEHAMG
ncbi:hypothetical protein BDD12DRAFT_844591 [Trichophaea hybrida]|nr:hypothetical protein BDD12DRAFT_844591 [Trichophaea hybrida]